MNLFTVSCSDKATVSSQTLQPTFTVCFHHVIFSLFDLLLFKSITCRIKFVRSFWLTAVWNRSILIRFVSPGLTGHCWKNPLCFPTADCGISRAGWQPLHCADAGEAFSLEESCLGFPHMLWRGCSPNHLEDWLLQEEKSCNRYNSWGLRSSCAPCDLDWRTSVMRLQICACVCGFQSCWRTQRLLHTAAALHSRHCWLGCWHFHSRHREAEEPYAWLAAEWSGRCSLHSSTGQPGNCKKALKRGKKITVS